MPHNSPLQGPGNVASPPVAIARFGAVPLAVPVNVGSLPQQLESPGINGISPVSEHGVIIGPGTDVRAPILPGLPVNRAG